MASANVEKKFEWISSFTNLPFKALKSSTLSVLSRHLDFQHDLVTVKEKLLRDWRGLADLLDFDVETERTYERKDNPPSELLKDLHITRPELTVEQMLHFVLRIERLDALNEARPAIERDAEKYWKNHAESRQTSRKTKEFSPLEKEWGTFWQEYVRDMCAQNDLPVMTRQEKRAGKSRVCWDAIVLSAESPKASEFVKEMVKGLEGERGHTLFIMDRDSLVGFPKFAVMTHVQQRCHRTIVVLSEGFINTTECDVLRKVSKTFMPGSKAQQIIPVRIDQSLQHPDILRDVTSYAGDRSWFWDRLHDTLSDDKAAPSCEDSGQLDRSALEGLGIIPATLLQVHEASERQENEEDLNEG